VAKETSNRPSTAEQRQIREAEQRIAALVQVVEQAHAEGRLAEVIRDTPQVREQLESPQDI
jgi:hypothetical protein